MRECEGNLSSMDFNQIIREVYGEIPSPISNTDSESSSQVLWTLRWRQYDLLYTKKF